MRVQGYRLRDGFRLNGDVQKIGERLGALKNEEGELTPTQIVHDARKKSSPMHGCFEWEDSEAARLYRLEQARYLLRSIEVIYEGTEKEEVITVAFVNLRERGPTTEPYQYIGTVLTDEKKREQLVKRALEDLRAFRAKYGHLKELSSIFAEVDRLSQSY